MGHHLHGVVRLFRLLTWTPHSAHKLGIPLKTRIDGGPEEKGSDVENGKFTKEEREYLLSLDAVDEVRAKSIVYSKHFKEECVFRQALL